MLQRYVAKRVPVDGCGRQKVSKRGRAWGWAAATLFREPCEVFPSFTSFESPVIFHLLADPVFAIAKVILAHDHFLAHGSIINAETMDMCLPPETVSH